MKTYTKIRQFYAWIGFIVTVLVVAVILAIVIHTWSKYIVKYGTVEHYQFNSEVAYN